MGTYDSWSFLSPFTAVSLAVLILLAVEASDYSYGLSSLLLFSDIYWD